MTAATGTVTPAETTLAGGVSVDPLSATFAASGTGTITVREKAFPSRSGSATVAVTARAGTSRYVIEGLPASLVAGTPAAFTVRALDSSGNVDVGYAGTATLGATGGSVTPATLAFAAGVSTGSAAVTFTIAGAQGVTASDAGPPALTGTRTVSVSAAPAARYLFSGLPPSVNAGQEVRFTLTAVDAFGNLDAAYAGTATLSCTDAQATHPASVVFAAGIAADVPITLRTAGPQTLTATDAANPLVTAQDAVNADGPPPPPAQDGGGGGCGCGAGGAAGLELLAAAAALLLSRRRAGR